MKRLPRVHVLRFVFLFCLITLPKVVLDLDAYVGSQHRLRLSHKYAHLPLAFEANRGQADAHVRFLARMAGYTLLLSDEDAQVSISGVTDSPADLRILLRNASRAAKVFGDESLPGTVNYFLGKDPAHWHTRVPTYARVKYQQIYPGVDLVFYGTRRDVEYDFILHPGASPDAIRLGIEGARNLRFVQGDLILANSGKQFRLRRPHTYQEWNGTRHEVASRFELRGHEIAFRVDAYDHSHPLVIDPVLAYSSYTSDNYNGIFSLTLDSSNNAYIAGLTPGSNRDVMLNKINADGAVALYTTYIGGSGDEYAPYVAVDSSGNAYVAGSTMSTDFPTKNAIQSTNHGGYDAFLTKISPDGNTLVYSTYLGGSVNDQTSGVAVDPAGYAYIVGSTGSTDFPTANALQKAALGEGDAFVAKINPAGDALVYSTYLCGSSYDFASAVAADSAGNAYVVGGTNSSDFPIHRALQATNHGQRDAFLTKINPSGSAYVYSTFLGGSGEDSVGAIALDSATNVYLLGTTGSTDFPTLNPIQSANAGLLDLFVTKVNSAGNTLVYSTYLGGSNNEFAYEMFNLTGGITIDTAGNAYITATTQSTDFPLLNAIQTGNAGKQDAVVAEINAAGSALVYSTYFGGNGYDTGSAIAVDSLGSVYFAGSTSSTNLPTTAATLQRSVGLAYLAKIAPQTFVRVNPPTLNYGNQVLRTTSAAKKITVTNNGTAALGINHVYVAGANPTSFATTSACGSSLQPGKQCTVSVTFTPIAISNLAAAVVISDSDAASPQAVKLLGTGTEVKLAPSPLNFGNQTVGTTSAAQSITLTNVGSTQMNLTGVSLAGSNPGDFSETSTCGSTVAAGGSCTISVKFTPTALGARSGTVWIRDNGGGSPQKVTLYGTGT